VHFVANHELHTRDPSLSINALRLLQRIAAHHPHAEFLAGTEGGWAAMGRQRALLRRGL
jgi:hypothetical protein